MIDGRRGFPGESGNDRREATSGSQRLRTEVQRVANNDVAARDELNRIIGDIERHMEEPGDASEHHGLLDQMRVAIRRFETEHPRATAILNDIMVTLSNMGI